MNPLDRKKHLKEQFKVQKEKEKNSIQNLSFEGLKIKLEQDTIEWYKAIRGGGARFE